MLLLLEDDDRVARGLLRISATLGRQAMHVRTVGEGMLALQQHPDIDVVVADLGVYPRCAGLELLTWARARYPSVRRVLTSATVRPRGYVDEPPMQWFLVKPFGRVELEAVLGPP